ncbi:MAG: DUF1847 domain-containing protein [Alphaproteobacteria bacterium]
MKCAVCGNKECHEGKDCAEGRADPRGQMSEEDEKIWRTASAVEAEFYLKKTRLEEIIEFARRMGYRKLGLAFCIGLQEEARLVHEILAAHFEVCSVCCKICGLDKDELGLPKIRAERTETACNPIGQAAIMSEEGTELNVVVGLCVGHDALFMKHSQAPVTTLAAKDRVLAHNPLGAIYSNYHRKNRFG